MALESFPRGGKKSKNKRPVDVVNIYNLILCFFISEREKTKLILVYIFKKKIEKKCVLCKNIIICIINAALL